MKATTSTSPSDVLLSSCTTDEAPSPGIVPVPTTPTTFHGFSKLPVELQIEIWELCLPERVCEDADALQMLAHNCSYSRLKAEGASIMDSSWRNRNQPVIGAVCRIARDVVCKAGKMVPNIAAMNKLSTYASHRDTYVDDKRYTFSLGQFPMALAESNTVAVLESWTNKAGQSKCQAAISVRSLIDVFRYPPTDAILSRRYEVAFTKLLKAQQISVVVHEYYVFADLEVAAATGLFGRCGDAYFQILDLEKDLDKINAIFSLHNSDQMPAVTLNPHGERGGLVLDPQRLRNDKHDVDSTGLRKLRTAITIRLCDSRLYRSRTKPAIKAPGPGAHPWQHFIYRQDRDLLAQPARREEIWIADLPGKFLVSV